MTAIIDEQIAGVLNLVRHWPDSQRRTLAHELLHGERQQQQNRRPPRQIPLEQIRGMLKTDAAPPTDEQIKQWIEEERLKKYG
jgi:hypothetical protein